MTVNDIVEEIRILLGHRHDFKEITLQLTRNYPEQFNHDFEQNMVKSDYSGEALCNFLATKSRLYLKPVFEAARETQLSNQSSRILLTIFANRSSQQQAIDQIFDDLRKVIGESHDLKVLTNELVLNHSFGNDFQIAMKNSNYSGHAFCDYLQTLPHNRIVSLLECVAKLQNNCQVSKDIELILKQNIVEACFQEKDRKTRSLFMSQLGEVICNVSSDDEMALSFRLKKKRLRKPSIRRHTEERIGKCRMEVCRKCSDTLLKTSDNIETDAKAQSLRFVAQQAQSSSSCFRVSDCGADNDARLCQLCGGEPVSHIIQTFVSNY